MSRPNKTEIKKYEEKLVSLRTEYDAENARLSSTIRQVEIAHQEYSEICAAKELANGLLRAVLVEVSDANKQLAKAKTELDHSRIEANGITERARSCQAESISAVREAEGRLRTLGKQIADSTRALDKLENQYDTAAKDTKQLESAAGKAIAEVKQADKKLSELARKEQEVRELLQKNSEVCTLSEKNLRTLEHNVKRLQRIYDKQGIKIDLLTQFGITRDRK